MLNEKQDAIGRMFDDIADTYDSVNRILAFRQDLRWRKTVAQEIPERASNILDVATGTADVLITLLERCPQISDAIGIDISKKMLRVGEHKLARGGWGNRAKLLQADAGQLPFCDHRFDVVTIAFGIRNVVKIDEALREMARVLKPDGQLLILEFSLPTNRLLRMFYLFYFRYLLPFIGGIFSGNFPAYRYLNRSVEKFPAPCDFVSQLNTCGFKTVDPKPLSLGIATLYCARKF